MAVKDIENILIAQDPEGLIKIGAPNDEYSSEAEMIYNRIRNENSIRDKSINFYVLKTAFVFYEMFGNSSSFIKNDKVFYDIKINENYLNKIMMEKFQKIGKLIFELVNGNK